MNVLKKTIMTSLMGLILSAASPFLSYSFTLDEDLFEFTITDQPITITPEAPYSFILADQQNGPQVSIINQTLGDLNLKLTAVYDASIGFDSSSEIIQDGFLLLDGTLGLSLLEAVAPPGRREGIRASGIRIGYRMNVTPESLRRAGGRIGSTVRLADARLMRFDEIRGTWIRAIRAIRDPGASIRAMGDSSPDNILGHYGYNSSGNYVWGVLDTNSKYAVGVKTAPIPEPGTIILLGLGLLGLAGCYRKIRSR